MANKSYSSVNFAKRPLDQFLGETTCEINTRKSGENVKEKRLVGIHRKKMVPLIAIFAIKRFSQLN